MGISDKQYDGFLLDNIEDWDDIIELLDAKEYEKALAQKTGNPFLLYKFPVHKV